MPKQNTVTQWFDPDQPPVHPGPYQVMIDGQPMMQGREWFAYWNGSRFGYRAFSPDAAFDAQDFPTVLPPHTHWRGIPRGPGRPPKSL